MARRKRVGNWHDGTVTFLKKKQSHGVQFWETIVFQASAWSLFAFIWAQRFLSSSWYGESIFWASCFAISLVFLNEAVGEEMKLRSEKKAC